MTFSLVGANSAGTASFVGTFSLPFPVGVAAGDLAIVTAMVNDSNPATATLDATPAGWTLLSFENGAASSFLSAAAWWKIVDATDVSAGAFLVNFSGFRSHSASIAVFRSTGTITFDSSMMQKGISGGPWDLTPGLSPAGTALVALCLTASQVGTTYTWEAGYSTATSNSTGLRTSAIGYNLSVPPGATGDLTARIDPSFYGVASWAVAFTDTPPDPNVLVPLAAGLGLNTPGVATKVEKRYVPGAGTLGLNTPAMAVGKLLRYGADVPASMGLNTPTLALGKVVSLGVVAPGFGLTVDPVGTKVVKALAPAAGTLGLNAAVVAYAKLVALGLDPATLGLGAEVVGMDYGAYLILELAAATFGLGASLGRVTVAEALAAWHTQGSARPAGSPHATLIPATTRATPPGQE